MSGSPVVAKCRYAYFGPSGTFTEQALLTVPGADAAELIPMRTVDEALELVREGRADSALVPLENSIEGAVSATLDALVDGEPLVIVRDVVMEVSFSLFGATGQSLPDVRTVGTHPHAEAQCRRWLRTHLPDARRVVSASTADAARAVANGELDAAVCAPIAGHKYHLDELAKDIADNPGAVTRFVMVSRPVVPPPPTGRDLTSLVVYPPHDRVGSLMAMLNEFAVRGINLARIESRPTKEHLGRYCFFLDCEGHVASTRMGDALMGIRRSGFEVRFLGSYPAAGRLHGDTAAEGTRDDDYRVAREWLATLRTGETSTEEAPPVAR